MLDADDLVDSVAEAGQFLTLLVQLVLVDLEFDHRLIVKLPCLFFAEGFNDLQLFATPVEVVVKLPLLTTLFP